MKKEWKKTWVIFKKSFLALQNQNIEDENDQKVQEREHNTDKGMSENTQVVWEVNNKGKMVIQGNE